MQLFKHTFPAGVEVHVGTAADGGVRVSVSSARPQPTWLWGENANPERMRRPATLVPEAELERALLAEVQAEPGRAVSYYTQRPPAAGGVRASQPRKERAVARLLERGALQLVRLEKPQRRTTHVLQIAVNSAAL